MLENSHHQTGGPAAEQKQQFTLAMHEVREPLIAEINGLRAQLHMDPRGDGQSTDNDGAAPDLKAAASEAAAP